MSKIALVALFAAFTAAGAFLIIPIGPVPIVLQNMFVVLSGLILGPVLGTAAIALYTLSGILGLPVFAGGLGGIAGFAGPTGGFRIGYIFAAFLAGLIAGRPKPGIKTARPRLVIAAASGFLVVYVPGILWLAVGHNLSLFGAGGAFAIGFLPFIIGDVLKGIVSVFIAPRLRTTAAELLSGRK